MSFVEISHNFVVRNFRLSMDVMKIAKGKADAENLSAFMQRKSNCRANYFASGIIPKSGLCHIATQKIYSLEIHYNREKAKTKRCRKVIGSEIFENSVLLTGHWCELFVPVLATLCAHQKRSLLAGCGSTWCQCLYEKNR